MPIRSSTPSALLLSLASGILSSNAIAADTPPSSKDPSTPTVTVVGQRETGKTESAYKTETSKVGKLEQAPKDIPQSVTVVPEKLIKDRKDDSLKQALTNVAGLTFNAGEGGRIGDNITLRGYVAYGDLYQDGMRDIAQYNREVFNLERVEVLRGAASMLFGRGSTGGVINQVNKQAFLADENTATFTAGNHDYYRNTLDLNKQVGDTSALRLNTMITKSGGDPEGADSKRYGFAPTFRTGIGTPNEFEIGYYHLNYDDTPNYGYGWENAGTGTNGRPSDKTANKFYGLDSDFQRDSADAINARYTHRFNNKTQITSSLRYGEYKRDLWATTARPQPAQNVTDSTPFTRGNQRRAGEEHHLFSVTDFSSRFNLWGMKHELLIGTELAREQSERWSYAGTPTKAGGITSTPELSANQHLAPSNMRVNNNYFTASTMGVYAQDIVEFIPKWKLMLGTRWDKFKGSYDTPITNNSPVYTNFQRSDKLWSYRGGLIHDITDNLNVYAAYGSSFNTSGDLYQYDANTTNTKPEQSRNMELGSKAELIDGQLSVRVAMFRTEKYNERSTDVETTTNANILSGKRHTDGYEFEITGKPHPRWEVFFNYAHMWSNIDKAGNAANSQATIGRPAGNTPTNTGAWWNVIQITPVWYIGAGVDGQSKRNYLANQTNWAPGYVKYDAMVKYEQPRYTVQLNVNNLFNRIYWQSVYTGHSVQGPARTVQLTTEIKF